MLMLPSWNPSLWPGRALGFERAILTGCRPVAPHPLAIFLTRKAIRQLLPSRATIGVFLRQIDKVLLAEAPVRLSARGLRFGQSYGDACLVTREDLRAAEVAAISHGFERLCPEHYFRLLCHIGQLSSI